MHMKKVELYHVTCSIYYPLNIKYYIADSSKQLYFLQAVLYIFFPKTQISRTVGHYILEF